MNDIISRLTEYENDIKLFKKAVLAVEKNFSKIKSDIIDIYNQESINKNEVKEDKDKDKVKKYKDKKVCSFKKNSITLSTNLKEFFDINDNDEILVSKLNKKINAYLIEKDLIKDKKVYLNKNLKTLLKTKKRIIELDELLTIIVKVFN